MSYHVDGPDVATDIFSCVCGLGLGLKRRKHDVASQETKSNNKGILQTHVNVTFFASRRNPKILGFTSNTPSTVYKAGINSGPEPGISPDCSRRSKQTPGNGQPQQLILPTMGRMLLADSTSVCCDTLQWDAGGKMKVDVLSRHFFINSLQVGHLNVATVSTLNAVAPMCEMRALRQRLKRKQVLVFLKRDMRQTLSATNLSDRSNVQKRNHDNRETYGLHSSVGAIYNISSRHHQRLVRHLDPATNVGKPQRQGAHVLRTPYMLAWDKQSVIGHLCTRGEEGQGPAVHMAFRRQEWEQPIWFCDTCMEAMSTMRDRPYVPGQELQAQESFHIRSLGVAAKNSLDLAGEGMEPTGENGLKKGIDQLDRKQKHHPSRVYGFSKQEHARWIDTRRGWAGLGATRWGRYEEGEKKGQAAFPRFRASPGHRDNSFGWTRLKVLKEGRRIDRELVTTATKKYLD
ncbi:uncharacterized protein BO96DRAFT_429353 [Aspergillus niger CBS 101883]|uniref:uncharacterized protein n=1 Tax=Aspergillus lacticoffeatus (strain CBS 101883) TaxID=1450533 RepID=UPI000D7FC460|nr:uncharacterized protein BO96DRAFT_429353 [Aspergillus niger CBS 101883]PYH62852.1 hypothetical protein BO96DRAFT_429353 [Aspergillus niger CBS 101883]